MPRAADRERIGGGQRAGRAEPDRARVDCEAAGKGVGSVSKKERPVAGFVDSAVRDHAAKRELRRGAGGHGNGLRGGAQIHGPAERGRAGAALRQRPVKDEIWIERRAIGEREGVDCQRTRAVHRAGDRHVRKDIVEGLDIQCAGGIDRTAYPSEAKRCSSPVPGCRH